MTEVLTAIEVNCETGEKTIRPLTAEEIANGKKMAEELAKRQAEQEAQEQAKAEIRASAIAKLAALGLTEDEAKAIVG